MEQTSKSKSQFGLQAATRLHEAGIASNRESECRGEYAVSYTHLDVYKRQDFPSAEPAGDFMKNQKKMPMLWYIHQRFPLPRERIKIL